VSKSLRNTRLPPIPEGPITGAALRNILTQWQTLVLAEVDIRDAGSEASTTLTETIDPLPKVDEPATIESPWTFDELYTNSLESLGSISGSALAATGAVSGASVAATGALSGASATVTGVVSAGSLTLTSAAVGSTVGAAGAASALPAQPTGYLSISINGTVRKIPYYES
jgi:hypothetical protein